MTTDDIGALMGKPWRDTSEKLTITGTGLLLPNVTQTRKLYWHEGNSVASVELTDGYVTAVKLRQFPNWWLRDGDDYGRSMSEAKQLLGPPSRSAQRGVAGKKSTWWVYTDKAASERTLVLTFDAKGQRNTSMILPNVSEYDDIVSD